MKNTSLHVLHIQRTLLRILYCNSFYYLTLLFVIVQFSIPLSIALSPLALNSKTGTKILHFFDCHFVHFGFGLSLTAIGRTEVRIITLTPISPNRLLCDVFFTNQLLHEHLVIQFAVSLSPLRQQKLSTEFPLLHYLSCFQAEKFVLFELR